MSFELHFIQISQLEKEQILNFVAEYSNGKEIFDVQTSGSTGKPKTIQLTKKQLSASAKRTNRFFQLTAKSNVLLPISFETIAGKMAIVRAIEGNYSLHIHSATSDFSFLQETSYDLVSLVPVQLENLLKNPENILLFKQLLIGGSSLHIFIENQLKNIHSASFIGYGMTETVSHIALRKLGEKSYQLLEGVSIESNEKGTLINDKLLSINNLQVSDVLEIHPDNSFTFIGRNDFVINSGGIKVHPEIVENVIAKSLTIPFMILGLPNEKWGEEVILLTEVALHEETFKLIQTEITSEINKYAVPKRWIKGEICWNGTKINRKTSKELLIK